MDLAISSDEIEGEKMEYVYAAMLLHSAEKEIDENGVSAVLTAAGVAFAATPLLLELATADPVIIS